MFLTERLVVWLMGAFLLVVYSAMFPVLGLVSIAFFVVAWRHALRHGVLRRLAAMFLFLVLSFMGIANIEIVRAYHAVQNHLSSNNGWNIPLTAIEFWAAAMGQYYFMTYLFRETVSCLAKWVQWASLLTIPMTALFIVGIPSVIRRDRASLVTATLGILIFLLVGFGLMTSNPWTGGPVNSYQVFKVIQWAFPIVAIAQVVGLASVAPRFQACANRTWFRQAYLFVGVFCLLALAWVPGHVFDARQAWISMKTITGSPAPFEALTKMGQAVDAQQWDTLHLFRPESNSPWPYLMYAYFLYPRPISASWVGVDYLDENFVHEQVATQSGRRTLFLLIGTSVFGDRGIPLPANLRALGQDPSVIDISVTNGMAFGSKEAWFWIGDSPATLTIFSPLDKVIRMKLLLSPGPGLSEIPNPRIVISSANDFFETRTIASSVGLLELALPVNQGFTSMRLALLDRSSDAMQSQGAPPLIKVKMIALE